MSFEHIGRETQDQIPKNGLIAGLGEKRAAAESEKSLSAIASRVRSDFFNSIRGQKFTIENIDTSRASAVIATGRKDSMGYLFVMEAGSDHAVAVSEKTILESPEGRSKIESILDEEGLNEEDKKKVIGFMSPRPN